MFKLSFYLVRNKINSYDKFKVLSIKIINELLSTDAIKQNCKYYQVSYIIPYVKISKYDGIFEMWFDNFESINIIKRHFDLEKFAENSANVLNLNECNYIISEEYPPILGIEIIYSPKRIKFTTLLIRNEEMNFNVFKDYHKNHHIQLFSSIPVIKRNIKKYVVSHQIEKSESKKDYDGIVEFWFNSLFSIIMVFINPKYLSKVRPDERRFLNLNKCDFIISKEYTDLIKLK
jgi:hypothetical protein